MPAKILHVRQAAVSALRAWAKGNDYAESLVERHAHRRMLSSADRNLLQAILFGVLRNRRLLDHWIGELRKGDLDPETRDILRVGLCQILLLGIPDHAAVNETVEVGKAAVRGLINAVLRRAIVQRQRLMDDVKELPPAVALSHPDWLYKRWRLAFGKEDAIRLMEWNNQPAGVFFRVNPLAGESGDMPGAAVEGVDGFCRLEGSFPSRLVNDGAIYIQDPATRHAVELLGPAEGERILDACAAPGGKAFLSAVMMGGGGGLVCTDSNEKRLPRLEENLHRLHVRGVEVRVHDWNQPAPAEWNGGFDGVLLDVPCSNTGVVRRRVDVRWRIQPQDIERLVVTQRRILENAALCVAEGGRLVYSTCSIDNDENSGVVKAFLTDHPEWKLVEERVILPFVHQTDGAYAARLEKVG
jgi:16S rRNA (cytosine967-C5)-methyltransferase